MNLTLNDTRHYINPKTLTFTNHVTKSIWWNPSSGLRIYPEPPYPFIFNTFTPNTLNIDFLRTLLNKNIVRISANIFHDYSAVYSQKNVTRFVCSDRIIIWCPNPSFSLSSDQPKILSQYISLLDIYIKYGSIKRQIS